MEKHISYLKEERHCSVLCLLGFHDLHGNSGKVSVLASRGQSSLLSIGDVKVSVVWSLPQGLGRVL